MHPRKPNNRIKPSAASIISRTRVGGIAFVAAGALRGLRKPCRARTGAQMVKFTVKELPPTGSDGDDIALPLGAFMMMPFGDRDRFGLGLLTLIALNVVEP